MPHTAADSRYLFVVPSSWVKEYNDPLVPLIVYIYIAVFVPLAVVVVIVVVVIVVIILVSNSKLSEGVLLGLLLILVLRREGVKLRILGLYCC